MKGGRKCARVNGSIPKTEDGGLLDMGILLFLHLSIQLSQFISASRTQRDLGSISLDTVREDIFGLKYWIWLSWWI